jgi:hypothetical protein
LVVDEFNNGNQNSFISPLYTSLLNKNILAKVSIDNNHYTFASYDNNGNVCRYYDDDKISNEIPSDIKLGNNGKLLLYKEVSR